MNADSVQKIMSTLGLEPTRGNDLPLGNKPDPFDELVYIILTTMTQYGAAQAFDDLRVQFESWDQLLEPWAETTLRGVIQKCGLVNQKVPQIIAIARQLDADFGRVTLDPLKEMTDDEAEAYLTSLPRVGTKVARCVLLYSLGRDVLPVDAHVWRVSRRVGILPVGTSWSKAHNAIHEVVPPELRYAVHVGLVEHGRSVCSHKTPDCPECPLKYVCPSSSVIAT